MNIALQNRRVVDKVLTNLVLGYDLDQEFSGHHLFPDVDVLEIGGKIIKWGKEAFVILNTKRAPGETVRGIGISYSADDYVLNNRLLEALSPEEFIEAAELANIQIKSQNVNTVYRLMRLEGEYDKAKLALDPTHYGATNKAALSGTDQWSNPNADVLTQVEDAKSSIRAKTGRYPNVFHLDAAGYQALKRNIAIREQFKYSGNASITTDLLAQYFDVEKVVVGKAVATGVDGEFEDIWKDGSVLAFVPPKSLQSKASQSYGYNYVLKGFPLVEKEYYDKSDRSWHNPVLFRDKAVMTDNGAGFLFQNTTA